MDETILLPSPNWFLVSGMAISSDGWLFYGGPSRSLCVLEPVSEDHNGVFTNHKGFRTHVFPRAHKEKIIAIDVNPMWVESRCIMTGAADGTVKQWTIEKGDRSLNLTSTHTNSIHANDQEEVVGVGYSSDRYAVTVGGNGKIVKWDLKANIIRSFDHLILSKFKPTCVTCSPHILLHVAVGTKQGVLIVASLVDEGKVLYKVRSHDEEILSMSWCPQYNVFVNKFLRESERRKSANVRMERIRQEAENEASEQFNDSGVTKTLPDDSFDDPVVEEDDMFDIYKDHAEDEFGHKKYQPEVIAVKVTKDKEKEMDYLAECQKLKDEILKKKNEPEPTINSLVDAFDKAHVTDDTEHGEGKSVTDKMENPKAECEHRKLPHKHLLATVGKNGNLRVWSKNGKLLGSGVINNTFSKNMSQKARQPMWATLLWYKPDVLLITDAKGQLLECNPLKIDCKNKLEWRLVDTLHKRGLFCIASNAPRLQNPSQDSNQTESNNNSQSESQTNSSEEQNGTEQQNIASSQLPEDQWYVWTAAQDRNIACYSMMKRKKICNYHTCGGIIYTIEPCPYDARKVAFSVGDGAIRVWEADVSDDDDTKMTFGTTTSYWQNVQGKVLTVAWHPTKEHLLAFGTAESRVGIVDTSGKCEKPARVMDMGSSGGVYCLSWGERGELYACADGDIILHPHTKDAEPKNISVKLEGQAWQVTSAKWFPTGMLCGSFTGSVALLDNKTYEILAVIFVFKKMIHSIEWHPQFTSNSSEESQFKDMIAVTSLDKSNNIAILKYSANEDGKKLETHMLLEGHSGTVLQVVWNPHIEGQLLSSAQDDTARVWDVSTGACKAIFTGHNGFVNGVAWSPFPQLGNVAISGGADCCVRVWKTDDYPPELYQESKKDNKTSSRKERKKKAKAEEALNKPKVVEEVFDPDSGVYGEGQEAEIMDAKPKSHKKFLMPITARQMTNCGALAVRKLAQKCCNDLAADSSGDEAQAYDTDFIKLFGTTNELNELLDKEMERHLANRAYDAWIMLSIFRGQIDNMIQFAAKHDLLCPFLVSMAPCVSFKYWKDVTALYVAQIDRLVAQKQEHKLTESRGYGGATFRKAALLLSVHDARAAAAALVAARLHRDAYLLCRVRHMDSIAQEILRSWVQDSIVNGLPKMTIICYLALGEIYKASTTIAGMKKDDETWLSLAADLAKASGQHTFAGHLEGKKEQAKQDLKDDEIENTLEKLPTRIELLMRNDHNGIENESESAETKE